MTKSDEEIAVIDIEDAETSSSTSSPSQPRRRTRSSHKEEEWTPSRLRTRKSVTYNEEDNDDDILLRKTKSGSSSSTATLHSEGDSDAEEIFLNEFKVDSDAEASAAIQCGFPAERMNGDELIELPHLSKDQKTYAKLRNHILNRWNTNKSQFLLLPDSLIQINDTYHGMATSCYKFLHRFGYINIGMTAERPAPQPKSKKIIVIGAGFAGLAAAHQLVNFGYQVQILEARDRVGGRVFTDHSLGAPIDLGASIVTGTVGNPVVTICDQTKIDLHVIGDNGTLYDIDGRPVDRELDERVEQHFNEILDETCSLKHEKDKKVLLKFAQEQVSQFHTFGVVNPNLLNAPNSPISPKSPTSRTSKEEIINTLTLGKSLQKNTEAYLQKIEDEDIRETERRIIYWHIANLEYGCGTDLDPVSLAHWDQDDQFELVGGHCFVKQGFSSVAHALANGLSIQHNTPVSKIEYTEQGVKVYPTAKQEDTSATPVYEGDAVLVTVPLGVLQKRMITFSPPLPTWKTDAIDALGFGLLNKVVLKFPYVFWDKDQDWLGNVASNTDERGDCYLLWNMHQFLDEPILVALVAGAAAFTLEKKEHKDCVEKMMSFLRRVYGEVPEPTNYIITSWHQDKYAGGSYSFIPSGATGEDYDIMAKTVKKKVFFAGEATCRQHPATVLGAFQSGLREAANIDKTLSTPTSEAVKSPKEVKKRKLAEAFEQPSGKSQSKGWKRSVFSTNKKRRKNKGMAIKSSQPTPDRKPPANIPQDHYAALKQSAVLFAMMNQNQAANAFSMGSARAVSLPLPPTIPMPMNVPMPMGFHFPQMFSMPTFTAPAPTSSSKSPPKVPIQPKLASSPISSSASPKKSSSPSRRIESAYITNNSNNASTTVKSEKSPSKVKQSKAAGLTVNTTPQSPTIPVQFMYTMPMYPATIPMVPLAPASMYTYQPRIVTPMMPMAANPLQAAAAMLASPVASAKKSSPLSARVVPSPTAGKTPSRQG